MKSENILIFGAGSIGSYLAAKIYNSGYHVDVIGRKAEKIGNLLYINNKRYDFPPVSYEIDAGKKYDYVFLTSKMFDLKKNLNHLSKTDFNIGIPVLVQNCFFDIEEYKKILGQDIVSILVYDGFNLTGNQLNHIKGAGFFIEDNQLSEDVYLLLKNAGADINKTDDIVRQRAEKTIYNCSINIFSAIYSKSFMPFVMICLNVYENILKLIQIRIFCSEFFHYFYKGGIHLTQVTTRCSIWAMEDYPRTLTEFEARFSTEDACRQYVYRLRWPEGFVCPRCNGRRGWLTERDLVVCVGRDYHASVTAGTIFENTHKSLMLWFRAIWWLTSLKTGASALGLQRILGLGSYKTAWTWLHKLRRAMVRPGRDRLSGRVEVDETYLGAVEKGLRGREMEKKALIVVAAQEDGRRVCRVRMRRIQDASASSLVPFIEESIEPGSVVHTDGWEGYAGLEKKDYQHEVTILARRKEPAFELLPRVHHVVGLLKTWLAGTLHGAVSHEHLDYYLDEFTFRFNRRTSRSRGKLFYRMVQQAVQVDPVPYHALVKHVRDHRIADHKM